MEVYAKILLISLHMHMHKMQNLHKFRVGS